MLISTIFSKRKFALSMIVLSILLLAVAPLFTPPYVVISLITILMYVILTLSWTMFSGPTNYISLATAALFGIGAWRDPPPTSITADLTRRLRLLAGPDTPDEVDRSPIIGPIITRVPA